jgi:hypothetical protein
LLEIYAEAENTGVPQITKAYETFSGINPGRRKRNVGGKDRFWIRLDLDNYHNHCYHLPLQPGIFRRIRQMPRVTGQNNAIQVMGC